jgi:hypothetical protein
MSESLTTTIVTNILSSPIQAHQLEGQVTGTGLPFDPLRPGDSTFVPRFGWPLLATSVR